VSGTHTHDTIIIGGGFYGLRIAQFLVDELGIKDVLVIEKEADVMQRASYNNQARVHNGYHYPRSVLTALRSRVNLPIFSKEYDEAVDSEFTKYYAVAKNFSKVSARQFLRFYERIGAEIAPAPEAMQYFDDRLIEQAFLVKEYGFNSATLRKTILHSLAGRPVDIHTGERVDHIRRVASGIEVVTDEKTYKAKHVLNTGYSMINHINKASGLPILSLKHELTEMGLVAMPIELQNKAFTIMCGPFFSLMPFPDKGLYTMSHVRYTPHQEWRDSDEKVEDLHQYLADNKQQTRFPAMQADIQRYMPAAKKITYSGESLWEIKTVLQASEGDDSRPILYKSHYGGIKNYICIMGAKVDNIYDVFRELRETYEKGL
jgi:glycine/D-amino acid oxidase-like deaminating enzyme